MKFIEQYNNKKNIRYESYRFALSEAYKRNHKTLVETGVARGKRSFLFFSKPNWKDGMSTLIFGNYANYVDGELFSCDINQKNINNAKSFTDKFSKNINFINKNSIDFLEGFKKKIDFLYLDSLDGQFENASKHQLNEIKAAEDKLNTNSLVLLDDKGSKTNLSIDYMLSKKFNIIYETNEQVLLSCNFKI